MRKGMKHPPWKQTAAALLPLFAAASLFLTACGSRGGSSASSFHSDTTATVTETTAAAENLAMDSGSGAGNGIAPVADTASSEAPSVQNRKLIRTVYLTVETDEFDLLIKSLKEQINALSGYVEQSSTSGSSMLYGNQPGSRYSSMVIRIPSKDLDQFIAQVEEGGNVTNRSESTEDVTLQYSDLESRKKTLTVEQDRIWALLEKADTLEAVIALEERLSEIRYELESMESRLRLYDNQVDYSTVNLDIREVTVYTPTEPESVGTRIQKGFSKNLEGLGVFLTNLFVLIISGSPIWIPLALLIAFIVWLIRRRGRNPFAKKGLPKMPETSESQEPPAE